MSAFKLTIEYDGTDYFGFQKQKDPLRYPTIQWKLEKTLGRILSRNVRVVAAGRTDTGVHATGQVISFEAPISGADIAEVMRAANAIMRDDIRIIDWEEVEPGFNPRYMARARVYEYNILISSKASPFLCRYCHNRGGPFDISTMREAAGHFVGTRDFSSYTVGLMKEGGNPTRTVFNFEIITGEGVMNNPFRPVFPQDRAPGEMLVMEVRGDGFLRRMVRMMVGTLLRVGRGMMAPSDVNRILDARDSRLGGPAAPAKGLFLKEVIF